MFISNIIILLLVGFSILSCIDYALGNRYGYGEKFLEGIKAMGTLGISMLGILYLSPLISKIAIPIISPLFNFFNWDYGIIPGLFLANDMGGYSLSIDFALNTDVGLFSGLFLSATIGATLSFSIPIALGIIDKKDEEIFILGILSGIATAPLGTFLGVLFTNFDKKLIVLNLIPVFILTFFTCFLLIFFPKFITKLFFYFGKLIFFISIIGFILILFDEFFNITLISEKIDFSQSIYIVGRIALVLSGAYPLLHFITHFFKKYLEKIGGFLGINKYSITGLISSLAHNIPTYHLLKNMDSKGKILNVAFSVSGAFILGSHLGFTAGIDKNLVFPVIMGKLYGGILAIILASFVYKRVINKHF